MISWLASVVLTFRIWWKLLPLLRKAIFIWGWRPPFDDDTWEFLKAHYPKEFKEAEAEIAAFKRRWA